jgi:hypothetical protein
LQIKQEVTEKGEEGVETSAVFSEHGVAWSIFSSIMDLLCSIYYYLSIFTLILIL